MNVLMPQLGETVETGTVVAWLRKPGEAVKEGEPLFEVETDKVTSEIPAPADGVLSEVLVPVGQTVKVGVTIAVLSSQAAQPLATAPSMAADSRPTQAEESPQANTVTRNRLSPAVRRLLASHAIRPDQLSGTGRDGRITRNDVLQYVSRSESGSEVIPFTSMRKRIAEHMVRSKATSPHVLQAVEADFSQIDRLRRDVALEWRAQEGFSLTYLPFIAQAVCKALKAFPRLNGVVDNDGLKLHKHVNLAIAVDLSHEGLLAPVIKQASALTVRQLARAINALAQRARANQVTPDELQSATYTISNSGSFGTLITAPIINQPQIAILSVDGVKRRPVVIKDADSESIGIRPIGILAQSFDHRAVDGAYSAGFLRALREVIESPAWTLDSLPSA